MRRKSPFIRRYSIAAVILALVGQACTVSLFNPPSPTGATPGPAADIPTVTPQPVAQTTFIVTIPEPLQPNETLIISTLDEVTGLSLNATPYPMTAIDQLTYSATLPLPYNSVVKYRYSRRIGTEDINEDTSLGTVIRYRLHYVAGPSEVRDIIADWVLKSYSRPMGSILGQVYNADTGSPLPNILVSAGGVQYITDSLGRFQLPGLPLGTQQLIAYSLDGMYQPFQQGAVVGENQETLVDLRIKPAKLVHITFIVSVPTGTVPGVPVRIAGNVLQLGNTFADLSGGVSTNTDRMPIMSLQPDGRYAYTIGLAEGTYIQYKYTLGDGFWNSERKSNGGWLLRELIVPSQDLTIEEAVSQWTVDDTAPIRFEVTIPSVTPVSDIVYIQFNTFGWMEPLPMWPVGNNKWTYTLYGPLNFLGNFHYRYCRNGQCGSADDSDTAGASPTGRQVATSILGQEIRDVIRSWKWFENPEPTTLVGSVITARTNSFVAGVEYQPTFHPNWSYYAPQAFANTQALGANLAVITPTWTYTSRDPLRFTTSPGHDPLWIDSAIMISQARALGLNIAIFPTPNFPKPSNPATSPSADFWLNAPRDAQWWQTWFTRYRAFAVNYADLASQTGAQFLILGGDWIAPAVPGGKLPDGNPSNTPADVETQWKAIFTDVRSHFSGQIFWAMPYTESSINAPLNFLQDVDGVYLLWSAQLASNSGATKDELTNEAGRRLDNEVAPLASLLNKPVILAVAYPSASGAETGCVPNPVGGCLDVNLLSRPNDDIGTVSLNLQTQANLYESILTAVNGRSWVSGIVSRGYYLPAALQDKSTSVRNKPAADILWYWYPRLLGKIQ